MGLGGAAGGSKAKAPVLAAGGIGGEEFPARFLRASGLNPGPVSVTVKTISCPSSTASSVMVPPAGVKRTAIF